MLLAKNTSKSAARVHRALLSTRVSSPGFSVPPPMPIARAPDSLELNAQRQKERMASEFARQLIAAAQVRTTEERPPPGL
mmetsp:Transcript_35998/g.83452  ORF Transcript_35998/g.83452 Transcript_35998/m.83452 type:complete len:80 (+) Transcript_35998:74-313(+)